MGEPRKASEIAAGLPWPLVLEFEERVTFIEQVAETLPDVVEMSFRAANERLLRHGPYDPLGLAMLDYHVYAGSRLVVVREKVQAELDADEESG